MTAVAPTLPATPDPRPLVVVTAAVTVLEVTAFAPVWAGAPHHVALPPLDLFADVRVLLAESPSYPAFAGSLAAVVGLRSLALAAMLRSLNRDGVAAAARFYGVALPIALLAGGLAFSGVAAVYSLFLWAGVGLTLLATVVLGPQPWLRGVGRGRAVGRVLVYLGALVALSLASTLAGPGARVLLVWVSAVLTALAAHWIGGAGGVRTPPAAAMGVALAALAAIGATAPSIGWRPVAASTAGTLLVVPGIGGASGTSTMFQLDPAALGFDCEHTVYFSYAGRGDGAPQRDARCPIRQGAPYRTEDTKRPLDELVRSFRAQYDDLDPPVVVVAHSQGGWVAAAALGRPARVAPPAAVVLLGTFPGHRGGYDLDGAGAAVGSDFLELLTATLRRTGATSFEPRAPLARQLLGTSDAVVDLMRRGFAPGVRVVTITSAYDLPVMSDDRRLPGAVDLCPVYVHHGELPRTPRVHAQIRQGLQSSDEGRCGWWRRWPMQAFGAFAVPVRSG